MAELGFKSRHLIMVTSGQKSDNDSNLSWTWESCVLTQEHQKLLIDKSSSFFSIASIVYLCRIDTVVLFIFVEWVTVDYTFFICIFSPLFSPL